MTERLCLRCGAPYEEGATVCFTCGASIGELETPTQPVRAPQRPTASAEPAPEPKQPTPPAAPVATITNTPASPSRPLVVGGASYRAPVAAAPVSSRTRWPLIIGALVALIALATGGFFVARGLLAPKPVAQTTIYHDAQRRFSFAQPSLWTVTPNTSGALLSDSSGANTVTIIVAPAPATHSVSVIADTLAKQQGLHSASTTTIGGEQWQQFTGSVTGQDGATRIDTLYVDIHAGSLYTIESSSPTSVSSSMNTLVYQPLLASFTFS